MLMVKLSGADGLPKKLSNSDRIDLEDLLAQISDLSKVILVQEMPKRSTETKEKSVPPPPMMGLTVSPDCSGG